MKPLKVLRNFCSLVAFITVFIALFFIFRINKTLNIKHKQDNNLNIMRSFFRILLLFCGVRVKVSGLEHIKGAKYIYAANHTSYLDHLILLTSLPENFRGTALNMLFNLPLIGFLLKEIEAIPVERTLVKERSDAMLDQVIEALKEKAILIYPEGRFSKDGNLLEFRRGISEIALKSQVPVIPIVICNVYKILPPTPHKVIKKGVKFINYFLFWLGNILINFCPGEIKVFFSAPMRIMPDETTEDFTNRLRKHFVDQLKSCSD